MKGLVALMLLGLVGMVAVGAEKSPFAGTWKGEMNGLPGVDLTVEESGGKVSGSITFYFQRLHNDGKWHIEGKFTEPILSGRIEGKILTLEAAHHKSHDSPEFGPNVKFRVELAGANQISLKKVGGDSDGPPLKLTRQSDRSAEN